MTIRPFSFLRVLPLLMVLGTSLYAATITTAQSGTWSAGTTWVGGVAPVAGDIVIINGGFTVTVDVPNAACLSLQLGGSTLGTGSGTIVFASASQLTVSGLVTVGVTTNTPGSLTMTSGGTFICEGFAVNRLGTWTAGTGTIEFTATNTLPSVNTVDFNNLIIGVGTTTVSRNVTVAGDLTILTGATLNGGANTLTLTGMWVNDGTFTGNTGTVTFNRNGSPTITGTGANNFNLLRVDLGTNIANTLEVLSTNFSAPDPFLTLTNGTFKLSGTFTFTNSFFVGPIYNIQPTSGFWVNNPNVTVTAQAGGVSVRGLLRLSSGTYNVGTAADHSLEYVAGSSIIVDGGTLHIAGRLSRNSPAGTTSYTQSGGTVTVVEQGSTDPVFAGFDLGQAGSGFTMSGGTIVIRTVTSAPADYLNIAGTANVTGGTLQLGDALTPTAQTFRIQSTRSIGNLLVSNATLSLTKPTAQLISSSLNVVGGITIQSGTTLNANGFNLTVGGDWIDNGTFTSGGNSVTFNGTGAQALTVLGGDSFNNLTVNKSGGTLALTGSATVGNAFALALGTMSVGNAATLTLNAGVTGGGTLSSSVTGAVSYNQGSGGQSVLAGSYGNLTLNNFAKTFASAGTIGIAGTFTPGSSTAHTATGSTINFNGTGQSIPRFVYHNLTLSGSGTKSGSDTITVNGSLTNNSGIAFTGMLALLLNGATHTNDGTLSASTISVGPGGTLTNNGSATASGSLTGLGALAQSATGSLTIGGTVDITTLNASATGNTVNYTGAGQALSPAVYHHLTLSGSAVPSLAGVNTINGNLTLSGTVAPVAASGLTIGGNLSIGSGTSFAAGAFAHILKGNLTNSGTFTPGTSTVSMKGTSAQVINGAAFNRLIIDNAGGVSLASNATIGDTLTLTTGAFSVGAHTLTLNGILTIGTGSLSAGTTSHLVIGGSAPAITLPSLTLNAFTLNRATGGSLSGDVTVNGTLTITNGTLTTGANSAILGPSGALSEAAGQPIVGNVRTTRNVTATAGTESFGNIGADILLNGAALGNTNVLRKTGTASVGNTHSSIRRSFDITPTTNTGLNAGLVVHYDSTELSGQNVSALELYRSRDAGTTWNNLGGTVNSAARTLSASGLNDLSRWTASDTTNRIGSTASPVTASISPSTKAAGDTTFTIIVNGSEFVSGKSTVRLNGINKTTTYVNSKQLTAVIPSSDLTTVGTSLVTVFTTDGGGTSNAQTLTVTPGAPAVVRVETSVDGLGTVVPAQSLTSGSSTTVYAITRDALGNFVSNVAATAWTVENITGGIVTGDLVPSADKKSAVFTAHVIGTANIKAASGVLPTTTSGTVTATTGPAALVRVESAANGSGTVVPAQTVTAGTSITAYAITRDASQNFITNVAADGWALVSATGGVVQGDLVQALDKKSATFNAHVTGTALIQATSASLTKVSSGAITVTVGAAKSIVLASGNNQFANNSATLANPFVVTVTDTSGNPVSGVTVGFAIASTPPSAAGQALTTTSTTTNPSGQASTTLTMGNVRGTYTVNATSAGLTGSPILFAATARQLPTLSLSRSAVAFGSVRVGLFKDTTMTFTNAGDDTLKITNIVSTTGVFSPRGTARVLAGGQSFTDTLRFAPNAIGVLAAKIVITSNAVTVSDTVAVTGFGFGRGAVALSTAAIAFGNVGIAQFKDTTLTITNTGNDTLFVSNISASSGLFSSRRATFPLAPAQSLVDTVRFAPVGLGTVSAALVIASNALTSPDTVRLTGTGVTPTGVAETGSVPRIFALSQNYPNPFNPSTTIEYSLPQRSHVTLRVYNMIGQEVAELFDGEKDAGSYNVTFNAGRLSSGMYIYRLQAGNFVMAKRLVLLK